jgi:hypothetical protein
VLRPLLDAPKGHYPQIRPAHRLLRGAHRSVAGLLEAHQVLDEKRRSSNSSTKGRMAENELDVLRAAIIFTSSGLDASMRRLVTDVGRHLVGKAGTGARRQYEEFLKQELSKSNVAEGIRGAVREMDPTASLVDHYLAEKTRASFQGSDDLKRRVRNALGVSGSAISDSRLSSLDEFFRARNAIAHELDYTSSSAQSVARRHRNPDAVTEMCSNAFDVCGEMFVAVGACLKQAGT